MFDGPRFEATASQLRRAQPKFQGNVIWEAETQKGEKYRSETQVSNV